MKNQSPSWRLSEPRIIRFLGTGVVNTVFGYGVYALLVFLATPYLAALLVATVAGVVFNYYTLGRIVFNDSGGRLVFLKFVVAYGAIYIVNAALLAFLTRAVFSSPYLAQVICVPPCVVISWLLMRYWVYKK